MAVLPIVKYGEPILRKRAENIADVQTVLPLVDNMFETMYEEAGMGLAANQVGLDMNFAVIDISHAEEDEYGFKGITYRFSTPTVKGFGISEHFEHSTKNYYFVKCSCCNNWAAPDFFRDTVVPGYDGDLTSWSNADAKNPPPVTFIKAKIRI